MGICSAIIKLFVIYILRFCMYCLRIFPVKKGRIIFNSYRGSQYSCNPKYISEYLEKYNNGNYELIWAFNHPEKYYYLKDRGIKVVKYGSLKRFYYESTCTFSVNNVGSFSWLPTRNGQYHINTWHGGGCYKKVSLGEKRNGYLYIKSLLLTADETSFFISSSKFSTNNIIPNDFGYKGKILNYGLPRNDVFFDDDEMLQLKNKVLKQFDLLNNVYIILYAPTWRYDMTCNITFPDFKSISTIISEKTGRDVCVLVRRHPNLRTNIDHGYIDVTSYPDMQELLCASDMLISDYSSCIWDYSFTFRPCILFIPDLKEYETERGFCIDIRKWGFPISTDNEELKKIIKNFDVHKFKKSIDEHHKVLGSFENGYARKAIMNLIDLKIKGD